MIEYYRLSLLTKNDYCEPWEEIYFVINSDKLDRRINPFPDTRPIFSRLKKISKEEAIGVLGRC